MIKKICVLLVMVFTNIMVVSALNINDCEIVFSFKLSSSLDENKYVCKNKKYGNSNDKIYYDVDNNILVLNNATIYYLTDYNESIKIKIIGNNNINLLHLNNKVTITGGGTLKFREESFVKKVDNGDKVYQYVYDNRYLVDQNKNIYEGTLLELSEDYNSLKEINKLPEEFKEEDYKLIQATDFINITPISITPAWLDTYISTNGMTSVENGYGIIKGKEEVATTLKSKEITLTSEKKLNEKYKLKVNDLSKEKEQYQDSVEGTMLKIYDISIFKGKKQVTIKDGIYTIKIKIDEKELSKYDNYNIVYIDDNNEIKETIEGTIEDGYLVFKVTHLSQYGIVGKKEELKEEEKIVLPSISTPNHNIIDIVLKSSFIALFAIVCLFGILFIYQKSKNINSYKRKA